MFGFFRKQTSDEKARSAAIKAQVAEILALGPETTISVSEIDCGDVSCPGLETVILVMTPGARTRAYKIAGALGGVDEAAVRSALAMPVL